MEDVLSLIESGILELYVLGELSAGERKGVEDMIRQHPAIKAEVNEIEKALEWYALKNAIPPTDSQRNMVLNNDAVGKSRPSAPTTKKSIKNQT